MDKKTISYARPPRPASLALIALALLAPPLPRAQAASGTEAASFLDIPVGARAAALGAAYTALAVDAYAPVWNPAGLGFLKPNELSAMHLSYLETMSFEFASFVHPLSPGRAVGFSVQYLRPGDIDGTDASGAPIGSFSGHYTAYSLAYGRMLGDKTSLGLTGKFIDARISDVSAHAAAFDAGAMYQAAPSLRLAAVLGNVGTRLTFIDQRDPLPAVFRLGGVYGPVNNLNLTAEGVYQFTGLASAHAGAEWLPSPYLSLRAGFRTDTLSHLSNVAGLSAGIGLHLFGHEFDYAWVPLGDLGNTQYFSLLLRFAAPAGASKAAPAAAGTDDQGRTTENIPEVPL